jgi:hypothetical protein
MSLETDNTFSADELPMFEQTTPLGLEACRQARHLIVSQLSEDGAIERVWCHTCKAWITRRQERTTK